MDRAGKAVFLLRALRGTNNVKSTMWLWKDHANEIEREDIKAI